MTKPAEKKNKRTGRHNARRMAMQALYQWQFTQMNAQQLAAQFLEDDTVHLDMDYFTHCVHGAVEQIALIDQTIIPCLDRKIEELNPVELAVLRLATYELKARLDVPYKVIINEALELCKVFGSQDGYKYVNGVLNALAPKLREAEVQENRK